MDGTARPLRHSLRFRLSLWLSVWILCVAVVSGTVSVIVAYHEAHGLQDDLLRHTASLFDRHHPPSVQSRTAPGAVDSDVEDRVLVRLVPRGRERGSSAAHPRFAADLRAGLRTLELGGVPYRVFVRVLDSGDRIVAAQQTEVRNEAARNAALQALIPVLILVPILLVVVGVLIRRLFAPIARIATGLDQRGGEDLDPIPLTGVPTEIRPFVTAINSLLDRVRRSLSMQRRFVATAAHELRSPLTALSLQAERLSGSEMPDETRARLATLRQGIERNRWLVDQLLTLARAQTSASPAPAAGDVAQALRRVLEDLMPIATSKDIDIGVQGETALRVSMNDPDLQAVLRNLVGNAIDYTPAGGRIDILCALADGDVELTVEDNGPGIPASEREQVFEAFHRPAGSDGTGSGLGLSIVRTLVERAAGRVELDDARRAGSGLRVCVRIPAAPPVNGIRGQQRPGKAAHSSGWESRPGNR